MTTFNHAQPRGHKSNPGRWTSREHSAPEGTLVDDRLEREAEAERMIELVRVRSATFARRYRFNSATEQDIVQDTLVDLLNQQKLYGLEELHAVKLVSVVVRSVAQRYLNPNMRHEDLTAHRIWAAAVDGEVQAQGHELSWVRKKELADEIRLSFPPNRRPGADYWRIGLASSELSVDALSVKGVSSSASFLERIVDTHEVGVFATDESVVADTVDALSIGVGERLVDGQGRPIERLTAKEVRIQAWNYIAASTNAPRVHPKSVPHRHAERLRQETKDRIVETLLIKADYAQDLWFSALAIAVRR